MLILSFDEIEKILNARLPKSAARPQWWANETSGTHVQAAAWKKAGYDAFLLNGADKVKFKKRAAGR